MEPDKIYLTWDDVEKYCMRDLPEKLGDWKPDVIVGILRGGLIPAVMMSHQINVPMKSLHWQTRDGEWQEVNTDILAYCAAGKNVLFVDDINDSGKTMTEISKMYGTDKGNVRFASMVDRASTTFGVDYLGLKVLSDNWVVFPWE